MSTEMAIATLEPSIKLALSAAGVFLLVGLLTGVWKYLQIARSPEAQAHPYVDIAHRAALLYSFAALVLAALAAVSVWSPLTHFLAVLMPVIFFAAAIASYVLHGWLADTDNQLRAPHRLGGREVPGWPLHVFMMALIVAEIGGVVVLLCGALLGLWAG